MEENVTSQRVLEELAVIAFADCGAYLSLEGGVLTVGDIPKGTSARAVQSVEKTSTGIRVKFYDKLKALELLGKATGLFDGMAERGGSNLLDAIVSATEGEVDADELPEFQ